MSKSKKFFVISAVVGFILRPLFGQVGNDNATGTSGEFSGEITTGCLYDPYTANAKRVVTDLVVAGSVGAYPLAFTRISNTRYTAGLGAEMGDAGGWRYSYQYSIDATYTKSGSPKNYTVNYPDGRRIVFDNKNSGSDPYLRSKPGVRDRLQLVVDSSGNGNCYLLKPDGGKFGFSVAPGPANESSTILFIFTFRGIIDPYGQITTITHPADGTTVITEPAGRWIKLYYSAYGIDHITASDGRSVTYSYTMYYTHGSFPRGYVTLTGVTYFGDPTLHATYAYKPDNTSSPDGPPLLGTCDDPMYAGPMKKIKYLYHTYSNNTPTGVYGEIRSEKSAGDDVVSTLSVDSTNRRSERKGDNNSRGFIYDSTGIIKSWTDFRGKTTAQTHDANGFLSSVTDRNNHLTNVVCDPVSSLVTRVTYPTTPGDTPPGTPAGAISYTYGWASCPDPNNRDVNNPYYLYGMTDEGGHTTIYLRDASKRVTQINYPDGGTESFTYNGFGQILTHRLLAGGLETYTYDSRGLLTEYRDAYHLATVDSQYPSVPPNATPTLRFRYDSRDRVSDVTDALGASVGDPNHSTSYSYNDRGQVLSITHPVDPVDGQRHGVLTQFNPDGTTANITDELGHLTSFTYDDYKRPLTVSTPGHDTPQATFTYYDTNGTGNDYTHTDANATHVTSAGGHKFVTTYDANLRKVSDTAAFGTADGATTTYGYDNAGNLTSIVRPNEQPGQQFAGKSAITAYDERNRVMSVTDALIKTTFFNYDSAGRKASIQRPNGQLITYDNYDAMNRLLQQTVKQTPNPDAVTKYTYYPSGLLSTMQDPLLVANNSGYNYGYGYDLMGRKTGITYPPPYTIDKAPLISEKFAYDSAGRVSTFTNRNDKTQTFSYDALNRQIGFSWDDGITPSVTFGYDIGLRMTSIVNENAAVARTYFNDNLLKSETTTTTTDSSTPRTVSYTYDSDSNRATIQYPHGTHSYSYNYTTRNQLRTLIDNSNNGTVASYTYDPNGNLLARSLANSSSSTFTYDTLDRITHISHVLADTTRTFDYAYDEVGNRKWTKRDGNTGDVFGYDLNGQATSALLNVANPDTTPPGNQTITYDANGNRLAFSAYGPTDTYTTNNLNQYITRNSVQATYNLNGNMTTGLDGSTYSYDAQNRLISATKGSTTLGFEYDGLGRNVSDGIYDGWNLIGRYKGTIPFGPSYLYGAGGFVKNPDNNQYFYQDANGSTSHLADSTGHLQEWYRYDLQGSPIVYDASNTQISSAHTFYLFTGQEWIASLGLYDLRNRFYSPDIGRFLQADPIGFGGDATNLYRYCGNNPLSGADPTGLFYVNYSQLGIGLGNTALAYFEMQGSIAFGFATSETYVGPAIGALGAADSMFRSQYGVSNIVGAFIDSEEARAFVDQPKGLGDFIGQEIGGQNGQMYGGYFSDALGAVTARGAIGKTLAVGQAAEDAFEAYIDTRINPADHGQIPNDWNRPPVDYEKANNPYLNACFAGLGDSIGMSPEDFNAMRAYIASIIAGASVGLPQGSISGVEPAVNRSGRLIWAPVFDNAAFVRGGASYFTSSISSTISATGGRAIGIIDIDFGGEVFSGGEGAQCWRAMQ